MSDLLCIMRPRYIIVNSDKTEVFCGLARHYRFESISTVKDVSIKTYRSEKTAISSFIKSWMNVTEEDFVNGTYKVLEVLETIQEIPK